MSQEKVEIVRGARIALTPLSEGASQRRSLDERLFVRLPPVGYSRHTRQPIVGTSTGSLWAGIPGASIAPAPT